MTKSNLVELGAVIWLMDFSGLAEKCREGSLRFGVPKHSELEPDYRLAQGNGSFAADCGLMLAASHDGKTNLCRPSDPLRYFWPHNKYSRLPLRVKAFLRSDLTMQLVMAKKATRKAPARSRANAETIGQRLARLRRERGLTQVMLADQVGIIHALISDYERDKLRLNPDMSVKLAQAFGVSTDQLRGLQPTKENGRQPPRKVLRRLEQIENLPRRDQDALLRTIDAFLAKSAA